MKTTNQIVHELRGLHWHGRNCPCGDCQEIDNHGYILNPDYEENIADAWELIEEIAKEKDVEVFFNGDERGWLVTFTAGDSNCHHNKPYDHTDRHGYSHAEAEEKTPTEAICKAFIAWKESK